MVDSRFLLLFLIVVLLLENFLLIVFLVLQVSQVSSFWPFPESAIDFKWTEQRHLRFRRQPKIDCKQLDEGITLQAIINAGCTHIKPVSGQLEIRVAEVPMYWENFTANLRIIEGITFVFQNLPLQKIEFPNLNFTDSSTLKFLDNLQLTSINVMTANHLNGSLYILYNPNLETIKVAAGPRLGQKGPGRLDGRNIRIHDNAKLQTIDMDGIGEILFYEDILITKNPNLKEIKMGSLVGLAGVSFDLSGNTALEKFELPALKNFFVSTSASIKKNDNLSKIFFNPQMEHAYVKSFEIVQNKKLAALEMAYSQVKMSNLRVRGNPNLLEKTLADLYNIQVSGIKEIQEVGECIFDNSIYSFSELNDCVVINGDVRFTAATGSISSPIKLKTFNGFVDLGDLRPEQVSFLANVKITRAIKSRICDFRLGSHPVLIVNPNCPTTTTTTTTTTTMTSGKPPATSATTPMTTTTRTPSRIPFPATTKDAPIVKPPKVTPSGSRDPPGNSLDSENTAKAGGSKIGIIGGAVAGAVILIILIIILVCCCVPIGKVKLYKKVFSKDNGTSHEAATPLLRGNRMGGSRSREGRVITPRRREVQNGGRSWRRIQDKPKFSLYKLLSKKVIRGTGSQEPTEEVTGTPLLSEQQTPRTLSLESVSARAPSEHMEESATGRAPTDRSQMRTAQLKDSTRVVAKGPERFYVTKDGEVLRQPRLNYQHELLNKMEDFLGNEENYEDVIEEIKDDDEQDNNKKEDTNNSKKDGHKQ